MCTDDRLKNSYYRLSYRYLPWEACNYRLLKVTNDLICIPNFITSAFHLKVHWKKTDSKISLMWHLLVSVPNKHVFFFRLKKMQSVRSLCSSAGFFIMLFVASMMWLLHLHDTHMHDTHMHALSFIVKNRVSSLHNHEMRKEQNVVERKQVHRWRWRMRCSRGDLESEES